LVKKWARLYRAVDESGQFVDVLLREKHDVEKLCSFLLFERIEAKCLLCVFQLHPMQLPERNYEGPG